MRTLLFVLGLTLLPALAPAAVYKWTDANGTVHFTDTPREGAEEVHVAPPQTYTPAPLPPITPRPEAPPLPIDYTRFELTAPAEETTLRDNTGDITVTFAMDPALKVGRGHKLVVLLDGQAQPPVKANTVILKNVDRGSHSIQGQIVDSRGEVLMASQSITVHLFRQSIMAPNRARPAPP